MPKDHDNTNTGALFKNHRKREGKRDPKLVGGLDQIVCPECGSKSDYWANGWIHRIEKGDRAGENMISLSLRPKQDDKDAGSSTEPSTPKQEGFDDDIPF